MSALNSLKLVAAKRPQSASPIVQRRNKLIAEQMSTFCNDLNGYMTSNGAVRPASKAAAPAAAKPAAAKA